MSKGLFQFDEYVLDAERLRLSRAGEVLPTHPKAAETLLVLLEHSGEVVSKEDLMNRLWPDTFVEEANLKQNIYVLRRTLGDDKGEPRYIATVPKRGYRFVGEVRQLEEDSTTTNGAAMQTAPVAVAPASKRQQRWWWAATALFAFAAIVAVLSFTRGKSVLTDKDTILLADWENKTGDAIFDGTLKQGLAVQLQQSPFLNLFPDAQARSTLRLMGRAADEKVTPDIGREICQRQGLKALIAGTIAPLGSHYAITLEAINSQSGAVFAREQIEADSKEQVLQSLSTATSQLRAKLGESLASIQEFDKPLQHVTTPSLEALKVYSTGVDNFRKGKLREAIPFLQRAIELDPDFASAYATLSFVYTNIGDVSRKVEAASKAFALKERASEYEKLLITDSYYSLALGDIDKTIELEELWKQSYPRDRGGPQNLAVSYWAIGQFEKAIVEAQEGLRREPRAGGLHSVHGQVLLPLNRYAEAKESYTEAIQLGFDAPSVRRALYRIAFVQGDVNAMQQQLAWWNGKTNEFRALKWEAEAAAFLGQWKKSQALLQSALDAALRNGNKESAADTLADQALWSALFGQLLPTKAAASRSVALDRSLETLLTCAHALALMGDKTQTFALMEEWAKHYPQGSFRNQIWPPLIKAAVELQQGNAQKALELLEAPTRYEHAAQFWPQYLRGQAYLQRKQGHEAAAEFQKILDHRGEAPMSVLYPLAQLGLARAAALSGDMTKARASYDAFLTLWKNADADLPILLAAKKEFDNLR